MFEKELPARPSLEQYKKQAKDLLCDCHSGLADALARLRKHHPRFHQLSSAELASKAVVLADAQLVLAREHGFESWPKLTRHIETLCIIRAVDAITDPVSAFIEVACVPRHADHNSGNLEHAEMILARYPEVATASIHAAAILADEATVRRFITEDRTHATAKGGPHSWDALTHLCFSRYLRLDPARSDAFVATTRALLDAGADAKTGWTEMIDHPTPRLTFESALYGAAGIAQHAGLTRLLLERGADPNDEETPYHVPETYDNTVITVLLESGKLNADSLTTMLLRKTDWHDEAGLRLCLKHGADPSRMTKWGNNALLHAVQRDNSLSMIALLLDHGADPTLHSNRGHQLSSLQMAAYRGRGDVLRLFAARGHALPTQGADALITACALGDVEAVGALQTAQAEAIIQLRAFGGMLLALFAGNDNVEGLRCLLRLGIGVDALYGDGDGYFDIARDSTALHVAAWRARHAAVKELIVRGANVNARDAKGRTPLMLAIKACVDSYWSDRRTTESIAVLLSAGASAKDIAMPTGYAEADDLLRAHTG